MRSGTDSPTALDIQKETCRTGDDSHITVLSVCTLFSGGGRRLCGFPEQHLPALELPPNESQQSPQSPAPALTLFPSLIAVAMFNHKMTLPPPLPLPVTAIRCQLGMHTLSLTCSGYLSSHMTHFSTPHVLALPAFSQSASELANRGDCMHGIAVHRVHAQAATHTPKN